MYEKHEMKVTFFTGEDSFVLTVNSGEDEPGSSSFSIKDDCEDS